MDDGFHELRREMKAQADLTTARFDRLERKLDRFIDAQLQFNQSQQQTNLKVERRLRALERPRRRPS
jgi:hypothetical protein